MIVALLVVSAPGRARAAQEDDLATADGIAAFHRGENERALELLGEALAHDEKNASARYHRALTLLRLGRLDDGIDDLRLVVAERPQSERAAAELGIALVKARRYEEALPWLRRAAADPGVRGAASFYRGFAEYRLGRDAVAVESFATAAETESFRLLARYYAGLLQYRLGNWSRARTVLSEVLEADPEPGLERETRRLLALVAGEGGSRVRVRGAVGFEYDSNIVLAPNDDAVADALEVTGRADGRATLLAEGEYAVVQSGGTRLSLGYQFSQSLYFDLSEYNLQDHAPSVNLVFGGDGLQGGLTARYDYYLLGSSTYLQQVAGGPWLRIPQHDFGEAQAFYRVRWQDYFFQNFADSLNAIRHDFGIRQAIYLAGPGRELWLGYQYFIDEALRETGDEFAYDANLVEAGVNWEFPDIATAAQLGYWYWFFDYDPASDGRKDGQHALTFQVRVRLNEWLGARLAYFGTFNGSNQPEFEYDRSIVGLALEAAY
jgi:Tfp pilus assembly protein PilF